MSDNKANRTFSVNKKRVLLRHENPLYSTWYTLFSTWYPRHFSAVVTHYPISATHAALYFKSSPRLYNWLLNQKHLGPYIRNFRENKAIPLRAKIISISLMWITMLYCVFFIVPYIWVKVILLIIAAGVTYHILSFKTLK